MALSQAGRVSLSVLPHRPTVQDRTRSRLLFRFLGNALPWASHLVWDPWHCCSWLGGSWHEAVSRCETSGLSVPGLLLWT